MLCSCSLSETWTMSACTKEVPSQRYVMECCALITYSAESQLWHTNSLSEYAQLLNVDAPQFGQESPNKFLIGYTAKAPSVSTSSVGASFFHDIVFLSFLFFRRARRVFRRGVFVFFDNLLCNFRRFDVSCTGAPLISSWELFGCFYGVGCAGAPQGQVWE